MPIANRYITSDSPPPDRPEDRRPLARSPSGTDSPQALPLFGFGHNRNGIARSTTHVPAHCILHESRQELIERVKLHQREQWLEQDREHEILDTKAQLHGDEESSPTPRRHRSSLLPPIEADDENEQGYNSNLSIEPPTSIERPRSALHSGDFRPSAAHDATSSKGTSDVSHGHDSANENAWLGTSPPAPWLSGSSLQANRRSAASVRPAQPRIPFDLRHRSSSYSSSPFVLKAPTSPLANASNVNDRDARDHFHESQQRNAERSNRRRTYSPIGASLGTINPGASLNVPLWRRDGSWPYQAHQPRRSISTLANSLSVTDDLVSPARSRKPSLVSDTSPLQRAPMIGRYEESILRGRMSSLPSRPLDFEAQIGVLGRGKCKSSLRCPPHITVPFPAVFFYSDDGSKMPNEAPSPYVGMILLENSQATTRADPSTSDRVSAMNMEQSLERMRNERQRERRDGVASSKGPKGAYRIPQAGQLQIVLRNPNRTAVKLFLVPYDLAEMQPGTKTFIRQRSFSAGPIIDMPLSARKNYGTDKPEAALSVSDDPKDRPVLRYVINLQICCPSKGRFYLYKSIRVVFANRVPDGKEKLRQEIQLPEPRYSPYRPDREERDPRVAEPSFKAPLQSYARYGNTPLPLDEPMIPAYIESSDLGERRDFAWETYAQHDDFTFPPRILAGGNAGTDGQNSQMEDSVDSLLDPCSPCSRPSSRSLSTTEQRPGSPLSPSQNLFERLSRNEWNGKGSTSRPCSPGLGPGESLIAREHRKLSSMPCSASHEEPPQPGS